jgi:hypothetical protein
MRGTAMTNLALVLVLLSSGLASAQEATTIASRYDGAESVFIGFLERGVDSSDGYTATFKVLQSIKGLKKSQNMVLVKAPADSRCGKYSENSEYLIYATRVKDELWADPCNGSKHISLAQPDLQYIHTVNAKVSPQCNPKKLRDLAAHAEIITKAEVVKIKPNISSWWSGIAKCMAYVTYDVRQVLKGEIKDKRIVVEHVLVQNSLTADVDIPRLSPSLFREGNVLLLFLESASTTRYTDGAKLNSQGVGYVNLDENCGAVIPDDNTDAFLKIKPAR